MTTRAWVGNADGNNNASNPDNWNPNDVPQPGDTLIINGGTINISHDDLAGNALTVNFSNFPVPIINLDDTDLQVSSTQPTPSGGTLILNASLNLIF
jgi:hypothetical protein